MKTKRLIKSLINSCLCIFNVILWILNINTVGEIITGIRVGKDRKEKLRYGLFTLIQYVTYSLFGIGFIITVYWWFKNDLSIAERLSDLKQS